MFEHRPKNLPFRTKDGLYATWLPDNRDNSNSNSFEEFVRAGIQWSKEPSSEEISSHEYALIGTFFARFIGAYTVSEILNQCTKDSPFKILLLDPLSPYAKARALALGTQPLKRALQGIWKLIEAANLWALNNHKTTETLDVNDLNYHESVDFLRSFVAEKDVPLDLKLYNNSIPSGPRLFLKDIVIAGHYCAHQSSLQLPWLMLVDNPDTKHDSFDVFWEEFNEIWEVDKGLSKDAKKTVKKPRVFVGSSVEGLDVAGKIQSALQHDCYIELWNQISMPGLSTAIEKLEDILDKYDYGIFVFTPDDQIEKRDNQTKVPRDNVIFEAGLFIGCKGRSHTFIVHPRDLEIQLPSDLAGVDPVKYEAGAPNLTASVGAACQDIRAAIKRRT